MWKNIGLKLQTLAKVLCWLGIIGSLIWAIVIWSQTNRYQSTILLGILYLVIGSLVAWIGSWAMYGLGLVVDYVENGAAVNAQSSYTPTTSAIAALAEEAEERRILEKGGWKCTCGRLNREYVSTCACGLNKREVVYRQSSAQNGENT